MKASKRPSTSPATRRNRVLMTFAFAGVVTSLRRIAVVRRWTKTASRWARRGVYRPLGRDIRDDRLIETDDVVLADRVRSSIGPLLKELDNPRVHVMAEGDRVLLHGDIISEDARERLEAAVRRVPGVGTVASYLHVGLLPGDMRPSVGRVEQSPSRKRPYAQLCTNCAALFPKNAMTSQPCCPRA
jgi:BON domain